MFFDLLLLIIIMNRTFFYHYPRGNSSFGFWWSPHCKTCLIPCRCHFCWIWAEQHSSVFIIKISQADVSDPKQTSCQDFDSGCLIKSAVKKNKSSGIFCLTVREVVIATCFKFIVFLLKRAATLCIQPGHWLFIHFSFAL